MRIVVLLRGGLTGVRGERKSRRKIFRWVGRRMRIIIVNRRSRDNKL